MPSSLVIRWNASRRPKEAMSDYAPSGVIHPFWVLKPKFFVASKRWPLCADIEKLLFADD
jgi:hypothetical protein